MTVQDQQLRVRMELADPAAGQHRPLVDAPIPGRIGRPLVFWSGVILTVIGISVRLVDFEQLRAVGISGSELSLLGQLSTVADFVGLFTAAWGVFPAGTFSRRMARLAQPDPAANDLAHTSDEGTAVHPLVARDNTLATMDTHAMTPAHWLMGGRLFLGLVMDTMKPATLAFILPGLKAEYGLSPAVASLYPLAALLGTTLGSIAFGYLGDIIGRRASFILTALVLGATGICGLMPGFGWQICMCFTMGLAAGGELPLIYSMLAETMPARHRGWLSVSIGGIGALCGFFVAGALAYILEPAFTWRALWLPNVPTALLMLGLLRWVPESPRYLLQRGYVAEAHRAMAQVGIHVSAAANGVLHAAGGTSTGQKPRVRELFQGRLRGTTITLCTYGLAWGLCNWGFITWLPSMLRDLGLDAAQASGLLATSALFALPGTVVAAALFAFWSSKRSAVLFAAATSVVLLSLGLGQSAVAEHRELVQVAIVALLISSSSMLGVLAPYSVELYPTALRGIGSGVVAASSKFSGVIGPGLIGALLTISPGLFFPALVVSAPIGLAAVLMAVRAKETRGKRLEELNEDEPGEAVAFAMAQ